MIINAIVGHSNRIIVCVAAKPAFSEPAIELHIGNKRKLPNKNDATIAIMYANKTNKCCLSFEFIAFPPLLKY